ncbi:MAG: hypothetical protein ACFFCW_41585, partial [Candidatus Hodarchaeota archaeon]
MRVCFLVAGLHAWGKMSGSGSTTRTLAIGLVKQGLDVCAVTPRRKGQKSVEYLDGIKVLSFNRFSIREQLRIYSTCGADIYHSQEASLGTWLAMKVAPDRKHVITYLDPRNLRDWLMILKSDLSEMHLRAIGAYLYEDTFFATHAVRKADAIFCPARCMLPIVQRKTGLKELPGFMPYPVKIPDSKIRKSDKPTVCFAGRWIQVKRPELFFELAWQFPDVQFIAMGKAESPRRDNYLRRKYNTIPNLKMLGWLDQFSSSSFQEALSKSWILINTDLRGGLPATFVEAPSFKCAILSSLNPDC